MGADETILWFFDAKKSKNFCRISEDVIACEGIYFSNNIK
jgi:hypothetical protein